VHLSHYQIIQISYFEIQAQIAFNRSDFSPNNQRQMYKNFQRMNNFGTNLQKNVGALQMHSNISSF